MLYICKSRLCAVAELKRLGERQALGVEGLLPRALYRYEIELDRILCRPSSNSPSTTFLRHVIP